MIRLLVLMALLLPRLAIAAPVVVTTGAHNGFTRIALDFGHPVDWQMGRTADGYALRVQGEKPDYDLAKVFQLIGKDRLSALGVDSATGDLQLGIGCACFAMPFAFRPSIVVIDLKPGKPPKASAFEQPLEIVAGSEAAKTTAYDWVAARTKAAMPKDGAGQTPTPTLPLPVAADMEPLRHALLEEMSRGAAAGLIDMSLPRDPKPGMVMTGPSAQIHLGDSPNYQTHLGEASDVPVTAKGGFCLPDTALDMTAWGDAALPVAQQMSDVMTGLVGEFDRPDPMAVAKAIKLDLYLGFGAEARAVLRAFPEQSAEAPYWDSMGFILDDRPDTTAAFTDMANCDTAAALWAALSIADLTHEPAVNSKAITRSFSALPPHLRRLLGARVAEKLLSIHEDLAARAIRDAVTRLPGEAMPDVTLLQAKMDVAEGDMTAAEARLTPLAAESGPASEDALAALIETTASQAKPVPVEQVDALAALAQERRGGADGARFDAAATLGRAAAGQFDLAFAALKDQPDLEPKIWNILAVLGTDDDIVRHAVLPQDINAPGLGAASAARIADRLLGLGFVNPARQWLSIAPGPDPKLVARLALAEGDGGAALQSVAGLTDNEALGLKAEALASTGNHRAAADVYKGMGKDDAFWSAEGLAQDWPVLASGGPAAWSDAAKALLLIPTPPAQNGAAESGPLANAKALVSASADTRAAIDALLTSVPSLPTPSQ